MCLCVFRFTSNLINYLNQDHERHHETTPPVVAKRHIHCLVWSAAHTRHHTDKEVSIVIDFSLGKGHGRVWGSDLTKEYVAVNADYRSWYCSKGSNKVASLFSFWIFVPCLFSLCVRLSLFFRFFPFVFGFLVTCSFPCCFALHLPYSLPCLLQSK